MHCNACSVGPSVSPRAALCYNWANLMLCTRTTGWHLLRALFSRMWHTCCTRRSIAVTDMCLPPCDSALGIPGTVYIRLRMGRLTGVA
jgi:hypothetical protein